MSTKPNSLTELMSKPGPKKKATKSKTEHIMYPTDMDSVIKIDDISDIRFHFGELYPSQVVNGKMILQEVEPYCIDFVRDKEKKYSEFIYGHIIKDEESDKYKLHVASIPKLQSMLEKKGFTLEKCFEFGNREKTKYPNDQFPSITSDWYLFHMLKNHRDLCGKAAPSEKCDSLKKMKRDMLKSYDLSLIVPTHGIPDKQSLSKLGHAPTPDVPVKEAEKATPRKRKTPPAEPTGEEGVAAPAPVRRKPGPKKKNPEPEGEALAKPVKAKKEKKKKSSSKSSEKSETEKPAKKQRASKKKKENAQEVVNPAKEEAVPAKQETAPSKEETDSTTFDFKIEPLIRVKGPTLATELLSELENNGLATQKYDDVILTGDTESNLKLVIPLAFVVEYLLRKQDISKYWFTKTPEVKVPHLKMPKFKHCETIKENNIAFKTYASLVRKTLDDYGEKLQALDAKAEPPVELKFQDMTLIEMAKKIAAQDYQSFSRFMFAYKNVNVPDFFHQNEDIQILVFSLYAVLKKEEPPKSTKFVSMF